MCLNLFCSTSFTIALYSAFWSNLPKSVYICLIKEENWLPMSIKLFLIIFAGYCWLCLLLFLGILDILKVMIKSVYFYIWFSIVPHQPFMLSIMVDEILIIIFTSNAHNGIFEMEIYKKLTFRKKYLLI